MSKVSKLIAVVIRRIIAVLKPSKKINDYINNAKGVYKSMLTNAYFPVASLSVSLVQFNTDILALDAAESDFTANPPKTTKEKRDIAKRVVDNDQRLLLSDVQKIADANPAKAEDIITSAGFSVKEPATHKKETGAKNTDVSGTVVITAEEASYHEWAQLATDGLTWIALRATTGSKKTVRGLVQHTTVTFRSAPIVSDKDDESAWTVYEPLFIL